MSFEDSDVVRSAVRVEGFRDDEFNYQLIRAIGLADYGGSTVGECLAVVAEITDGSPTSWTRAFERLAQRVEAEGRDVPGRRPAGERPGPPAAGLDLLPDRRVLRRGAVGGADGAGRPQPGLLLRGRRRCSTHRSSALDVPFDGGIAARLPGPPGRRGAGAPGPGRPSSPWAASTRAPRSSTSSSGVPGAERGWNVVVFDGPGQLGLHAHQPGA